MSIFFNGNLFPTHNRSRVSNYSELNINRFGSFDTLKLNIQSYTAYQNDANGKYYANVFSQKTQYTSWTDQGISTKVSSLFISTTHRQPTNQCNQYSNAYPREVNYSSSPIIQEVIEDDQNSPYRWNVNSPSNQYSNAYPREVNYSSSPIIQEVIEDDQNSPYRWNVNSPKAIMPSAEPTNSHSKQIVIKCDTGFGNKLFVRGNGSGMSWDKGIELRNIDKDTWILDVPKHSKDFEYKLLLNDQEWEEGENRKMCGIQQEIFPSSNFSTEQVVLKGDIGFGNQLFVRGNGPGMSWDKGIELRNIDKDTWVLEVPKNSKDFEYKLLLNDQEWEEGGNRKMSLGVKHDLTIPSFTSNHTKQIVLKHDAGFGNKLFVRGNGPGMSWDKGIELRNVDKDTWILDIPKNSKDFDYKLLLNDQEWEEGDNHRMGDSAKEIFPKF